MATAVAPRVVFSSSIKMETVADLKKLANELNPILGCEHAVLSRTPLVPTCGHRWSDPTRTVRRAGIRQVPPKSC